jgi:hypothetical protein
MAGMAALALVVSTLGCSGGDDDVVADPGGAPATAAAGQAGTNAGPGGANGGPDAPSGSANGASGQVDEPPTPPPTAPAGEAGGFSGPGGQNVDSCPYVDIDGLLASGAYAELHEQLQCIFENPENETEEFLEIARSADAVALEQLGG